MLAYCKHNEAMPDTMRASSDRVEIFSHMWRKEPFWDMGCVENETGEVRDYGRHDRS